MGKVRKMLFNNGPAVPYAPRLSETDNLNNTIEFDGEIGEDKVAKGGTKTAFEDLIRGPAPIPNTPATKFE